MCDAVGAVMDAGTAVYGNTTGWDNLHESSSQNHVAYRHDEGANALHFDGHAAWHRKTEISYRLATSDANDLDKRNQLWVPEATFLPRP